MKKLTAALLALFVLVFALSACSSSSTTEETTTAAETEAETTTVAGTSAQSDDSSDGTTSISVTVTVDCQDAVSFGYEAAINVAEDGIIYDDTVELDEEATVMDALDATGLVIASDESEYGPYVTSIQSLAQGDCGSSSGWTFTVNGEYPSTTADQVTLSDGDEISWIMYCVEGE